MDSNPKAQFGRRKPGMGAVPVAPLLLVGEVMRQGAEKYGITNWRKDPVSASTYYDAAMRHLMAWWDGENTDRESNLPHLAHAAANMLILLDARISDDLIDDRPPAGLASTVIEQKTKPFGTSTP